MEEPLPGPSICWASGDLLEALNISTFVDLLATRLRQIDTALHTEINNIDKSLDFGKKSKKYQTAWRNLADNIFVQTLKDLRDHGLEEYLDLSGDDLIDWISEKREIAIDLRGADCKDTCFYGADFSEAYFEGANCQRAHFFGADCNLASFIGTSCQNACFLGSDCVKGNFDGADCSNAVFYYANCDRANFSSAICVKANFLGSSLDAATFENADLWDAIFEKAGLSFIDFKNAKCQYTLFKKARRIENVNFIGANCENADFSETNINNCIFDYANLRNALFVETGIELTTFANSKLSSLTKFDERQRGERGNISPQLLFVLSETYLQIKSAYKNNALYDEAGKFYFREMHCRRKALPKRKVFKRGWEFLKEYMIGYGEKPEWMFFWMLGTVGLFSGLFTATGVECATNGAVFHFWPKALYLSVVTFATLGYGDFSPFGTLGKIFAGTEAMMGLIFVSLFVVSLARKIIRD